MTVASAADSSINRTQEISSALQSIFDAYDQWSVGEIDHFTAAFEAAISAGLNVILNGDIPGPLIGLFSKVVHFAEIWARIQDNEEGIVDDNGMPGRSFWASLESLRNEWERTETENSHAGGIEPVRQLLDMMADFPGRHDQIARMYGIYNADTDRYSGPFFNKNGTVNVQLIEQEGANPGSVVPVGWNPKHEQQKKTRLAGLSALARVRAKLAEQNRGPVDRDPATVEQLLREGQFAEAIAEAKGVSVQFVRNEARRLGIVLRSPDEVLNEAFEKMQRQERQDGPDGAYLRGMTESQAGFQNNVRGDVRELGGGMDSDLESDLDIDSDLGDSDLGSDVDSDLDSDLPSIPDEGSIMEDDRELTALKGPDLKAFCELAASENPSVTTAEVLQMIQADGQHASPIAVGRYLAQAKEN